MQGEGGVVRERSARAGLALHRVLDGTVDAVSAGLQDMFAADLLARLSDDSRGTVEIVLAEVMNNVVEHAYVDQPGKIDVWVTPRDGFLFVRVTDTGLPMPGGDAPDGVLGDLPDSQDLPEGGFGWFLIRSLTQDLSYARAGSENVLSFCVGVDYLV